MKNVLALSLMFAIALTVVAITTPQVLIAYRDSKESRFSKELDQLKQRIDELEKRKIV
jgi:hypothetical protein